MLVVTVAVGAVLGRLLRGRLRTGAHRRPDDEHTQKSFAWVVVAVPLAAACVAAGQWELEGMPRAAVYALLTVPLVALSAVDVDVLRLPDKLNAAAAGLAVVGLAVTAAAEDAWPDLARGFLAAVVLGLVYLVLAVIASFLPGSPFGMGDVKLAPALGLLLGYVGWTQVVVGSVLAFVLAVVVGTILVVARRGRRDTEIPFGPYLVSGTLLVLALPALG